MRHWCINISLFCVAAKIMILYTNASAHQTITMLLTMQNHDRFMRAASWHKHIMICGHSKIMTVHQAACHNTFMQQASVHTSIRILITNPVHLSFMHWLSVHKSITFLHLQQNHDSFYALRLGHDSCMQWGLAHTYFMVLLFLLCCTNHDSFVFALMLVA